MLGDFHSKSVQGEGGFKKLRERIRHSNQDNAMMSKWRAENMEYALLLPRSVLGINNAGRDNSGPRWGTDDVRSHVGRKQI